MLIRTPTMFSFDIFCRVIDNFGDAGVCWRLANELSSPPYQAQVRLWIDDLHTLQKITQLAIAPPLHAPPLSYYIRPNLSIHQWPDPKLLHSFHWPRPHSIIVETFASGIPAGIQQQLTNQHLWIILDHLSAEPWVEECHAVPSYLGTSQPKKYFFYPGFTPKTGGLLRHPKLLSQINDWQTRSRYWQWRQLAHHIKIDEHTIQRLCHSQVFFIFQYNHAPLIDLINFLTLQNRPTTLLFTADQDSLYQSAQHVLHTYSHHDSANNIKEPKLSCIQLPFVSQALFDRLLWSSDFNLVRGEDSWIRALWAQKPFLWQPYPQSQALHVHKLQAWLQLTPLPYAARLLISQWNNPAPVKINFSALHPTVLQHWRTRLQQHVYRLATQPSLSEHLIAFCTEHVPSQNI